MYVAKNFRQSLSCLSRVSVKSKNMWACHEIKGFLPCSSDIVILHLHCYFKAKQGTFFDEIAQFPLPSANIDKPLSATHRE
jgi:hypothetical protein